MSALAPCTIDAAKDALRDMIDEDPAFAAVHVQRGSASVNPPREREQVYVAGYRNWRRDDDYSDVGPELETYELVVVVNVHLLGATPVEVEHAAWRLVRELERLVDPARHGDPTLRGTVRRARVAGGMNELSGISEDKGYVCRLPVLIAVTAVL